MVRARSWYVRSAGVFRWLHIYLSMVSFAALLFFALTGITLNHPTWLGGSEQTVRDFQGQLTQELLAEPLDRFAIAEWLHSEQRLRGRATEFTVDEVECMVVFKAPGYAADVFIDRSKGTFTVSETSTSLTAVFNDLHKGRDAGRGWSWVIDLSAVLMILVSISGFGLLFFLKKRRMTGLLSAFIGTLLLVAAWVFLVPD